MNDNMFWKKEKLKMSTIHPEVSQVLNQNIFPFVKIMFYRIFPKFVCVIIRFFIKYEKLVWKSL